ncbi:hypothetical protein Dda_2074 [Drechslerella dactyloides]|uniref:Uncharacterized protein n=1 Tax=Drechslerella dactyloides TaxID=74499 RepID=A0AAD6J372_DREDA|nr:hypothetical protein Dda_2074 [Drechslerella dactyloides]
MSADGPCQCAQTGFCKCTTSGCFCSHGHEHPIHNKNFIYAVRKYDFEVAVAIAAKNKSDGIIETNLHEEVSAVDDHLSADGGMSTDNNHFADANDPDSAGELTPILDPESPVESITTSSCCSSGNNGASPIV